MVLRGGSDAYLDWGVFDGDHAGHDIHNPLRVDDNFVPQELIVKILHSTKLMKELNCLLDL